MSNPNPIQQPYPSTATGLDKVIQNINAKLANVTWLERIFNRAWSLPEVRENILYRQPRIYSGEKDYWNVMPNDDLQAFSFMIGVGPAFSPIDDLTPYTKTVKLSKRLDLIVFANLKAIDDTKDYPYTEELNDDIVDVLGGVQGVVIDNIWMEDIREVYEGFDLSEIERDYLYYPFTAIRYELLVSYWMEEGNNGKPIFCN